MTDNGHQHMHISLTHQKNAFEQDPFPSLAVRRERLDRIGRLLEAHEEKLCAAVSKDFGHRSPHETIMLEIAPLMGALRHTRSHLRNWMRPERRGRSIEFLQMSNWVQYQPLGIVGIMAPWNYPLLLALGPLIDVLAAGNRAMIKPSELVPETSALLTKLVGEYFKPQEVTVAQGGVAVAAAFSALPFDHLLFTGSTTVGKKVMAAAAANLTPITLELGGKSPAIIAPDYPVASAVKDIAFGKLMNAGQTCIAPDYVFVQRAKVTEFVTALVSQIHRLYPAMTAPEHYTSIVGLRAHERLVKGLRECRERGIRIVEVDIPLPKSGTSIQPTLLIDPPMDCLLMEEEIFGPVLPIIPYDTIDEAITFICSRPHPLALYIFSHEKAVQRKLLDKTISGNVTINGTLLHITQNDLPFGGVGSSGIGAYHGYEGFKRFSHAKGIAKVRVFNPARLAAPPYGRITRLLAKFLKR
ncbi:putative coniferyl-aldehyde dehydrogenase [Agrobacterium rubi TR3 = NBRC 13261]|uniref:Aldehyde dehydrogenase n=1 Tax=Agrobacterium rubi TR3 = NBRC 13261 TaxID=1368415 RepID=A0A081CPK1_9HYPH|nr:coniferyl aldehyde dehydrogenase [Agrobacterium rubi]GAK68597.1 putative coniferyl-aldehyde dehydrogenase [Agrobacterium rubi TR3 = NBRC 13261]